jgi:2-methylcitrate dehydratase PrpD
MTRELVRYARAIAFDALPASVILAAKTCVLDWFGCALAGSVEPLVRILVEEAVREGASPAATTIGHSLRTSAVWAAQINGSASHALDYDDTHLVMSGHPSVPVLPAVLALAEEEHASGARLLTAFIAGVETECRLGAAMGLGHYAAGWHSTATLGTFGGTAGCAHLLKLPEDAWLHGFGIAGTQAAGLKSVFGSMSKPLQAGKAAANGMSAARLAAQGFTSHTAIIEVAQGFGATHHGEWRPETLNRLQGRHLIRETVFKYHASCYLTHSAIEAVLTLAEEQKLKAGRVRRVELHVPEGHLLVCNIAEPRTGLEGKFSLRATAAMALLGDDTADPASFNDERMASADLCSMRDKIEVVPSTEVAGTQTSVEVQLDDGTTLSQTVDVGRPAEDLERQWERLRTKFIRLASPVIGEDAAWAMHNVIQNLEAVDDVSELLERCRVAR